MIMKAVTRISHISLLLYCLLNATCDARRTARGQSRTLVKEVKSCKGKSKGHVGVGKAATCAPSTSPSSSPSTKPSVSPSESPSNNPSESPSDKPTISKEPSSSPSDVPSRRPSSAPSDVPSNVPSVHPSTTPSVVPSTSPSRTPSAAPSMQPSSVPSVSPSGNPSESPSDWPSNNPSTAPSDEPSWKPSVFPSVGPSSTPSVIPSQVPSAEPSDVPSLAPSISSKPSVSSAPTAAFFQTLSFGSDIRSTCILPDPSETYGGNLNTDQLLVFEYLLFISNTTIEKEDIINIMEERIHDGLVQNFLKCDVGKSDSSNDQMKDFYVWSISPSPRDTILADPCDPQLVLETHPTPSNSSVCMVVEAQVQMEVYFPPVRRKLEPATVTSADPQVMAETGDYLVEAMAYGEFNGDDVLQTRFLGFVTNENGHAVVEGGLNVAGAESQWMQTPQDARLVGGAMTMAVAALCLVVVLALVVRRRRKRSEAYLRHLDGMSTWSNFGKDDDDEYGTEILGDNNSLGWFSDNDFLKNGISYLQERDRMREERQDVHRCTSAFCAICLANKQPTFIAAHSLNTNDILEDLQSTLLEDDSTKLSHPDTVIL